MDKNEFKKAFSKGARIARVSGSVSSNTIGAVGWLWGAVYCINSYQERKTSKVLSTLYKRMLNNTY